MALFGKQRRHPLEAFNQHAFDCAKCAKPVPLDGFTPLAPGTCPHCGDVNFVPLKVASYWLFHPLGGGGMGAVYKAYHENDPETALAVKVLPRNGKNNPLIISTMQNEAEISQSISGHICMVNTIEAGIDGDEHFIAMDYIAGERLDQRIEKLNRLPENEVLLMGLRMISALTHIYNRGYLFRDMKPQNIMVTPEEGAYLFDYGICMDIEQAWRAEAEVVEGSPVYFPPERILGEGELACSEIYSLGMVMYHALTGKSFFSSKELNNLVHQHMRTVRVSNMQAKMKDLSEDVATVLDRMIKRDMPARYQFYHECERDIMGLLQTRMEKSADGQLLAKGGKK